ncbi:hypothetical protein ONZ45_g14137 [Pleurotus djamor]|nr:hypothetical protein ONZ45_g14137 [Pleurotus djamor]
MYHTLCPYPLTESLEYVKFVVEQQVQRRGASHLKTWQTSALCGFLPEGAPRFVFTPDTNTPTDPLKDVLKAPVVLLDSCLDENPQLLHTLQLKKLASDHLDEPRLAPEGEELDPLEIYSTFFPSVIDRTAMTCVGLYPFFSGSLPYLEHYAR